MAVNVTIIYTGPIVDELRKGLEIASYFNPTGSYADSPVYTQGYANPDGVGDTKTYGKSIYATNVEGRGALAGLLPMASTTVKFALYDRAAMLAAKAKKDGTENTGITISVDGYEEELYWNQIAPHMVSEGFYTKVGDNEYGPKPASETSDGEGEGDGEGSDEGDGQ